MKIYSIISIRMLENLVDEIVSQKKMVEMMIIPQIDGKFGTFLFSSLIMKISDDKITEEIYNEEFNRYLSSLFINKNEERLRARMKKFYFYMSKNDMSNYEKNLNKYVKYIKKNVGGYLEGKENLVEKSMKWMKSVNPKLEFSILTNDNELDYFSSSEKQYIEKIIRKWKNK